MVQILLRRKSVTYATSKRLKPHSASSQSSIILIQLSFNVALDSTRQVRYLRPEDDSFESSPVPLVLDSETINTLQTIQVSKTIHTIH